MKHEEITDIRRVIFRPLQKPFGVISLVPSWTETLFYLGLTEKEILGRTDYCVHPRAKVRGVEKLGGPKDPNLNRIFRLDPDLIIMDREENRKEDVERMDMHWGVSRVFVTGPTTVDETLETVGQLGLLLNTRDRARELIENVRLWLDRIVKEDRGTVLYLVWTDPLIAASRQTYIGDVLESLGYKNVLDGSHLADVKKESSMAYPVVTLEEVIRLRPESVFLSTEPFPFQRKHVDRLRSQLHQIDSDYAERVDIRIVNGEYFSWYGSRMIPAFRYFVSHQMQP